MFPSSRRIARSEFPSPLPFRGMPHTTHFSLVVVPQKKKGPTKFSFVISSKIARRATARNRTRRRGYGAVRAILPNVVPAHLCIFFAKKGAAEISYKILEKEVTELLEKARLLS